MVQTGFKYLISISIILIIQGCTLMPENISLGNTVVISAKDCEKQGRRVAKGDIPAPEELYKDAHCAKSLIERAAPKGVVTIFGSSRTKEDMPAYINTRTFAYQWTKLAGDQYPILTGGGGGIMEAGNRGAHEADGKSLALSSYFKLVDSDNLNRYISEGYIASSFSQREADMIDYAAAVIIAPGGIGTEWEIFETIAKIQTRKKAPCPVLLLGKKEIWQTLLDRLQHLKEIKTISPEDVDLIQVAETPEIAVKILQRRLLK